MLKLLLPVLVVLGLSPSYASNWALSAESVDGDMFVWVNTDQIVKKGSKGYFTDNRQVKFWQATGFISFSGDPVVRVEYVKGLCSPLTIEEMTDRIAYSAPLNYYTPDGRNIKEKVEEDVSRSWTPAWQTMDAAGLVFACADSPNRAMQKFDSPDEMIDFMKRVIAKQKAKQMAEIAKQKAEKGRPF